VKAGRKQERLWWCEVCDGETVVCSLLYGQSLQETEFVWAVGNGLCMEG